MFETGLLCTGDIAEEARRPTCASAALTHNRHGLKTRLCGGVAGFVFMLALFAPVSINFATGEITINTALAGNGDGNSGKGKGNGGPNGKKRGHGNGNDDDDDNVEDDSNAPPANTLGDEQGGRDSGTGGMAEVEFAEAVDAVAGWSAEGPMTGTPPTTLPTISQVFSMGDEATVSAENELDLIANGWGAAN